MTHLLQGRRPLVLLMAAVLVGILLVVVGPLLSSLGENPEAALVGLFLLVVLLSQVWNMYTLRQKRQRPQSVTCQEALRLPEGSLVHVSGSIHPSEPVWAPWTSEPVVCFRRTRTQHYWDWVRSGQRRQGRENSGTHSGAWHQATRVTESAQSPDGFVVLTDRSGAIAAELSPDMFPEMQQIYRAVSTPEVENPTRPSAHMLTRYGNAAQGGVPIGEVEEVEGIRPGTFLHIIGKVHHAEGVSFVGVGDDDKEYSVSFGDPREEEAPLGRSYQRATILTGVFAGALAAVMVYLSPLGGLLTG